jgi:hypothetical protein
MKVNIWFRKIACYGVSSHVRFARMSKNINNSTLVGDFTVTAVNSFRSNATLLGIRRGVLQGIVLKTANVLGRRRFSSETGVCKEVSLKNAFRDVDSALVKIIRSGVWPKINFEHNKLITSLQTYICSLSKAGKNTEALQVIDYFSFSSLVRCLAINKVSSNSGKTSGPDNIVINDDNSKFNLYKETGFYNSISLPSMEVKYVELPKKDGGVRVIGISNLLDRVLQTQICLLLDPYYEGVLPELMFGFRKGRSALQAVGFLRSVLDRASKKYLGVLLCDIKKCFDSISHEKIIEHFLVPFR